MNHTFEDYAASLSRILSNRNWDDVYKLADRINKLRSSGGQLFICGNGGSAANAIHLANDFLYGASLQGEIDIKVEALSANTAVLTCLANDVGYEEIYSKQLLTKGSADVLLVLSGSGNSPNVIKAIEIASDLEMESYAILGYSGGRCKEIADVVIHFPVHDMQMSEDLQLICGHMCMQWLNKVSSHS